MGYNDDIFEVTVGKAIFCSKHCAMSAGHSEVNIVNMTFTTYDPLTYGALCCNCNAELEVFFIKFHPND